MKRSKRQSEAEKILQELAELMREKAALTKGFYSDADTALNRFIAIPEASELPFTRPDEEAIEAFLLDYADEKQSAQVITALTASRTFRHELLLMALDIEALMSKIEEQRNMWALIADKLKRSKTASS